MFGFYYNRGITMIMMTKMMMTSHLNGYSYNEEKENDGVKKESGTKDQNPPFILVMVTKETNALCYDMKIIRVAVIFVSIFLVKYINAFSLNV